MKIQSFIFVHDQNIILDFISHKKFNNLSNLKYVYLGDKEIDKIEHLPNVIIARNYEDNLENYPKLTSFTGWYVIWKNGLISEDYVNLFEYDINIESNFEDIIKNSLNNQKIDIFGYIPLNVHRPEFLKTKIWSDVLISSLIDKYNVNISQIISSLPDDKVCSVTSNHTFSRDSFEKYMSWIYPLIDDIKVSFYSGHQVERSISSFYLTNDINYKIIPDVLHHFQFDSHKTQGINQNKFINQYKHLLSE